jgi:hypothetical protein
MKTRTALRHVLTIVAMLSLLTACATTKEAPPGTPKLERLNRAPAGSSWAVSDTRSGSFGSGTTQSTIRSEGERDFQGRKYWAFSLDGVDLSYYDPEGRLVGRTVNGVLRETNDPGFQSFAWPLHVGRSWTHTFRFTDHTTGRSFDRVQFSSSVEAYEDVTTPAGTFKAFRVVHDNDSVRFTNWWSPELGTNVKSRSERKSNFYAGPGVRETELVSYDIKK